MLNCTKEIEPEDHDGAKKYVTNFSLEQFKLKKSYLTSKACQMMYNGIYTHDSTNLKNKIFSQCFWSQQCAFFNSISLYHQM